MTTRTLALLALFCVSTALAAGDPPATEAARAATKLDAAVREFSCKDERLDKALARLSETTGVPIDVIWGDLSAGNGVSKDVQVTFGFKNVSGARILDAMLRAAARAKAINDPNKQPAHEILDNGHVLVVSKRGMYTSYMSKRKYDVADLSKASEDKPDFMPALAKLIPEANPSVAWAKEKNDVGGTIAIDGKTLVVTQTDEGHRLVAAHLAQMRMSRLEPNAAEKPNPADEEAKAAVQRALKTKLREVRFDGTKLETATDTLREKGGVALFVNWAALKDAKVSRDLAVTLDVSNLTLAEALDKLLAEVGGDHVRLKYVTDQGVISISTAEDLALNVVTRVYDVRRALGGKEAREARVTALIKKVEGVDPLSWKDAGGKVGSVRELAGQLIITQTPEVHRKLAELLKDAAPADAVAPPIFGR